MTLEQIAQILETPLGRYDEYSDVVVVRERKRIMQIYAEIKGRQTLSSASLEARVRWLYGIKQLGELD